jgi:hypothetical protein
LEGEALLPEQTLARGVAFLFFAADAPAEDGSDLREVVFV